MSASDRIVVNAGGRRFETTIQTLVTSGSGYFRDLLGPTVVFVADDRGYLSFDLDEDARARKRRRMNNGGGEDSIFVDRNPDRFAHVLDFIRDKTLPVAIRRDNAVLTELARDADFLSFDLLKDACTTAYNVVTCERQKEESDDETKCEVQENDLIYRVSKQCKATMKEMFRLEMEQVLYEVKRSMKELLETECSDKLNYVERKIGVIESKMDDIERKVDDVPDDIKSTLNRLGWDAGRSVEDAKEDMGETIKEARNKIIGEVRNNVDLIILPALRKLKSDKRRPSHCRR